MKVGTDADILELTDEELVEKVFEVEDFTSTSVEDLNSFIQLLGYRGDGNPMTSTIEFLEDNPGAIEAILEWVASHLEDTQRAKLQDIIPLDNEPEELPECILEQRQPDYVNPYRFEPTDFHGIPSLEIKDGDQRALHG